MSFMEHSDGAAAHGVWSLSGAEDHYDVSGQQAADAESRVNPEIPEGGTDQSPLLMDQTCVAPDAAHSTGEPSPESSGGGTSDADPAAPLPGCSSWDCGEGFARVLFQLLLCAALACAGLCAPAVQAGRMPGGFVPGCIGGGDFFASNGEYTVFGGMDVVGPQNTFVATILDAASGRPAKTFLPAMMAPGQTRLLTNVQDTHVAAAASDGRGGWFIGGKFIIVVQEEHRDITKLNRFFCIYNVAHVLPDGSIDLNWGPDGFRGVRSTTSSSSVNALAFDGTHLYIGGKFNVAHFVNQSDPYNTTASYTRPAANLHAVDAGGSSRPWPVAGGVNGAVHALAVQDDNIIVGGEFTSGGIPARLGAVSSLVAANPGVVDSSWNPAPNGKVLSLAASNSTVYAGGDFTSLGATPYGSLAALHAPGSGLNAAARMTGWQTKASGSVRTLALDSTGGVLYAGGAFSSVESGGVHSTRTNLAALSASDGALRDWASGTFPNAPVNALTIHPNGAGDGVYAAGEFTAIEDSLGASHERLRFAALDDQHGDLLSWAPPADGAARTLCFSGAENIFVSGWFQYCGKGWRTGCGGLAAVRNATDEIMDWDLTVTNGAAYYGVQVVAVAGDFLYAGGGFSAIAGAPCNGVGKVDLRTGLVVSGWNPDVYSGGSMGVQAIVRVNERLYIAGEFWKVGGLNRSCFAEIDDDPASASYGQVTDFRIQVLAGAMGTPIVWTLAHDPDTNMLYGGGMFGALKEGGTGPGTGLLYTVGSVFAIDLTSRHVRDDFAPNLAGEFHDKACTINSIVASDKRVYVGGGFMYGRTAHGVEYYRGKQVISLDGDPLSPTFGMMPEDHWRPWVFGLHGGPSSNSLWNCGYAGIGQGLIIDGSTLICSMGSLKQPNGVNGVGFLDVRQDGMHCRQLDWAPKEFGLQVEPLWSGIASNRLYVREGWGTFTAFYLRPGMDADSLLPSARQGAVYAEPLYPEGVAPFTFSVTSGALPAGLGIDAASGVLTGVPAGSTGGKVYSFEISVTDSSGHPAPDDTGSKTFILFVDLPAGTGADVQQPVNCGFEAGETALGTPRLGEYARIRLATQAAKNGQHGLALDVEGGFETWALEPVSLPANAGAADDPTLWETEAPRHTGSFEWRVAAPAPGAAQSASYEIAFDYRIVNEADPLAQVAKDWYANLIFEYSANGGTIWTNAFGAGATQIGTGADVRGIYRRAPQTLTPTVQPASAGAFTHTTIALPGIVASGGILHCRLRWLTKHSLHTYDIKTGIYLDNLTITETTPRSSIAVLDGGAATPIAHLDPASGGREFGVWRIGAGSTAAATFIVRNAGSLPLTVDSLTIADAAAGSGDAGAFVLDAPAAQGWQPGVAGGFCATIGAGAEANFTVAFDPVTAGDKNAEVRFAHDDSTAPSPFSFALHGMGDSGPPAPSGPAIIVSDGTGDIAPGAGAAGARIFAGSGASTAGPPATLTLTITNTGGSDMTLGIPAVTGACASDFTADTSALPVVLAAGASTNFTVSFAPLSEGIKDAVVELVHNGTNAPTPFTFGVQGTSKTSTTRCADPDKKKEETLLPVIGCGLSPDGSGMPLWWCAAVLAVAGLIARGTARRQPRNLPHMAPVVLAGCIAFASAAGAVPPPSSGPPAFTTDGLLPPTHEQNAYSTTLESGGAGPFTYTVLAGQLPPGLTLDGGTGVISGTSTGGSGGKVYVFTAEVRDPNNDFDEREFTLFVDGPDWGNGVASLYLDLASGPYWEEDFELVDPAVPGVHGPIIGKAFAGDDARVRLGAEAANASATGLQADCDPGLASWPLPAGGAGQAIADDPARWETEAPEHVGIWQWALSPDAPPPIPAPSLGGYKFRFDYRVVNDTAVGWNVNFVFEYSEDDGANWLNAYGTGASVIGTGPGAIGIYREVPTGTPAGGFGSTDLTVVVSQPWPAGAYVRFRMRWLIRGSLDDVPATGIHIDNLRIIDGTPRAKFAVYDDPIGPIPLPLSFRQAASGPRDFGQQAVNVGPSAFSSFVIQNTGNADLELTHLAVADWYAGHGVHFTLDAPASEGWTLVDPLDPSLGYAATILPGGEARFSAAFSPLHAPPAVDGAGVKQARISVFHNDRNGPNSPFTFLLKGEGTNGTSSGPPLLILVSEPAGAIANGGAATPFPAQTAGAGAGLPLTVTVTNDGTSQDLNLGIPTLSGADAGEFAVDLTNFAMLVAPGASTTFDVLFAPATSGVKQANVVFGHDAPNTATPFAFAIEGDAIALIPLDWVTAPGLLGAQAEEGKQYDVLLRADGGIGPVRFELFNGALPAGLVLDGATGAIAGVPADGSAGDHVFSVDVIDDGVAPALRIGREFTLRVKTKATGGGRDDDNIPVLAGGGCAAVNGDRYTLWPLMLAAALLLLATMRSLVSRNYRIRELTRMRDRNKR